MKTPLQDLTQLMGGRLGASPAEVFNVLYMIRAHRSLAGIVLCCRRLAGLIDSYPAMTAEPAFEDQLHRIDLIRQIGTLADVDPHFLSGTIHHNLSVETPLRPHTGDSGLCDLLLIRPKDAASDEQHRVFENLLAWFAWQIWQHQARVHRVDEYRAYLDGKVPDLIKGEGSRVYSAFRAIRDLGDPRHEALAILTHALVQGMTPESAVLAARILRLAHSRSPQVALRKRLMRESSLSEVQVEETLCRACPKDAEPVSADIGRFLSLIWLRDPVGTRDQLTRRRNIARQVRRVDVARYGEVTLIGHELDADGLNKGFALEIVEHAPPRREIVDQAKGNSREADQNVPDDVDLDEDDPGDGESVEPSVVLYLGAGDPVRSAYAAQSALHHIERANAMLLWQNSRLSPEAIQAVAAIVSLEAGEDPLARRARLAVGLSLLSGRTLEEVCALTLVDSLEDPVLTERQPAPSLVITRVDHMLHVIAGSPDLKQPRELPEFCAPTARTLRLPLPLAWRPLIDVLESHHYQRSAKVLDAARMMIDALPESLAITPRGIAGALRLSLLEHGRDDLALLKVVVDVSDANTNNLIHYASYERAKVETLWRGIVTPWVGDLSDPPAVEVPGERVGCPHGIEISKVASALQDLKQRFNEAVRERRWPAVYNLMSLYLSNWLGLATAGRRTCQPVPRLITADGWALVSDKHRPDGSTDRYVPLGLAIQEQIKILHSLSEALSIVDDDFRACTMHDDHLLALRLFLNEQESVPFQPKFMDRTVPLRNLIPNWARKLVRSSADELNGRYKDAGLGHWVRGRHPWTTTSSFPAEEFRKEWLAVQSRLERELGFEVLRIDNLLLPKTWKTPLPMPRKPAVDPAACVISDEEIERLLKTGRSDFYEAVFDWETPSGEAALGLVRDALRSLKKRRGVDLAAHAEKLCEFIRIKTKIPLFASRPRARWQQNWMVDSREMQSLAYAEQHLLPAIGQDLSHLPEAGHDQRSLAIDTGRLIVAAALRGGILSTAHLDGLLAFIASEAPIQAVGRLRMVELKVRSRRSGELMRRTLLIEPYLASLISVERERLRGYIRPRLSGKASKRMAGWQAAYQAYLRSLEVPADLSLADFLAGLRQQLLLNASPVIAAYASGEVLTEDLPVSEFRRLTGLAPITGEQPLAPASRTEPSADDQVEAPVADLPEDLRKIDYVRKLSGFRSSDPEEWLRVIGIELNRCPGERPKPKAEVLLCCFARDLVLRMSNDAGHRLGKRTKGTIASHLHVIWRGLLGYTDLDSAATHVDEAVLQALWDATASHFPERKHHGAWSAFRTFLVSEKDVLADAGISLGPIDKSTQAWVSAKILSEEERLRINQRIASILSGIASPENRIAALRHLNVTAQIGARRAETEKLRCVDLDGDMIRIRPYEGRQLKTASSERVIPLAMLDADVIAELRQAVSAGHRKLIDADDDHDADGNNFFHRVAILMKDVTGDESIGPHHLRHTKSSMLLLAMLANVIDLDRLSDELPRVRDAIALAPQCKLLLSTAGQSGQGIKAISALLGHLHETTTLRHYVHTLGVALYGHHLGMPQIPLHTAFEKRLLSRATLSRLSKKCKDEGLSDHETARFLRDRLEEAAQLQLSRGFGLNTTSALVYRDETPLVRKGSFNLDPARLKAAEAMVHRFESAQEFFSGGKGSVPFDDINEIRCRLRWIATIGSGKKGSALPRHPMLTQGVDGTPLPAMIVAGLPARHAVLLMAWLERLQAEQPGDYEWLMHKWLHASESAEGSMRLDGEADELRVKRLITDPGLELEVRKVSVAESRISVRQIPRYRLRIRFLEEETDEGVESAAYSGRAAGAVRWVMTWVCATDRRLALE